MTASASRISAPCDMRQQAPFDFAWCDTHDETFPLGAVCTVFRGVLERNATSANARGDWDEYRHILDELALDDRARDTTNRRT